MRSVTVLVPRTLTWDKLVALLLKTWCLCGRLVESFEEAAREGIVVVFDGDTPREQLPADLEDIDVLQPYNRQKDVGSATEKVVRDHGLEELPGVRYLVEILNKNNATGYLKNDEGSLVALIREMFNIGAAKPSQSSRLGVISLLWPAATAFLKASEVDPTAVRATGNPFTVRNVRGMLRMAGWKEASITAYCDQLDRMFQKVAKKQEAAAQKAREKPVCTFEVPIFGTEQKGIGGFVETDDTRYAGEHFRSHQNTLVLVVRRSSGNVAIFCRGEQSFESLHAALDGKEPGLWFLDSRPTSPMLLNGSTTRSAPATALKKPEIIRLIQEHHVHRTRRMR